MRYLNLALLVAYPVAWFAPILQAGLGLPFMALDQISIVSGLASLWQADPGLAALVGLFAIITPYAKTLGLALRDFGHLNARWRRLLPGLGRLAMADIFVIALYITLAKGIGIGTVQVAWGLYLFTACVLASLACSLWSPAHLREDV